MTSRGTAVVTGASSGIGAAAVRALAGVGFEVVLGARRDDRLKELGVEIGPAATAFHLDVTDPEYVEALSQAVVECRVPSTEQAERSGSSRFHRPRRLNGNPCTTATYLAR